jgi:hypothetical protein
MLLHCTCHNRAKEFMTRDKSGKLKDTGVRFADIAGGVFVGIESATVALLQ